MEPDELERRLTEAFRDGPGRAPEGFEERVMARVLAPERTPAWLAVASDPLTAVGVTVMLLLALAASWWPGRLLRASFVASAWAWERAATLGDQLHPTAALASATLGFLLAVIAVWRVWRAAERAAVLALTGRPRI